MVRFRVEAIQDRKPGGSCEDSFGILHTEHMLAAIVADGAWQRIGATRLLKPLLAAYGEDTTPGGYASLLARDTSLAQLARDNSASLRETLLAANQRLREQLESVWGALTTVAILEREPELTPLRDDPRLIRLILPVCVTTLARIDLTSETLEFAHCGDTALFAFDRDGRVEQLSADQMQQHDERALQGALKLQADQGAGTLQEVIGDERVTAMNRDNGIYHNYEDENGQPDPTIGVGVVNGLPLLSAYIQEGRVSLADADAVLVCSDGFPLPAAYQESAAETSARLARMRSLIEARGLAGYIDEVRAQERADEARNRFARFGLHDDATAVYILRSDRRQ